MLDLEKISCNVFLQGYLSCLFMSEMLFGCEYLLLALGPQCKIYF